MISSMEVWLFAENRRLRRICRVLPPPAYSHSFTAFGVFAEYCRLWRSASADAMAAPVRFIGCLALAGRQPKKRPVIGLSGPPLVSAPSVRKHSHKAKQAPLRSGLVATGSRVAFGTQAIPRYPCSGRVASPTLRSRLLLPPGPLSGLLPSVASR